MNEMNLEPEARDRLNIRAVMTRRTACNHLRKAAQLADQGHYQDTERYILAANRMLAFAQDAEAQMGHPPEQAFIAPEISAGSIQEARMSVILKTLRSAGRAAQKNDLGLAVALAREGLALAGLRLWPPAPSDANDPKGESRFATVADLRHSDEDMPLR